MIIYYNNKQISSSLQINLSRWKRWSREFLPPDPLGGLQSGYARQYSMREAFQVGLGGHLVGFMKLSVHQVRTILTDLEPWLKRSGYFQWNPKMLQESADEKIKSNYGIYIRKGEMKGGRQETFCYAVVSRLPLTSKNLYHPELLRHQQEAEFINATEEIQASFFETPWVSFLSIGQFRKWFLDQLHPND